MPEDNNNIADFQSVSRDTREFQFLWRGMFSKGGEEDAVNMAFGAEVRKLIEAGNTDFLSTYLNWSYTNNLYLPINCRITQGVDYSTEISNLITKTNTVGGNSITVFGTDIKKASLKLTIIKTGKFWVPYSAALEALAIMSGSPRYAGGLWLYAFDMTDMNKARRYKVVIEKLVPSQRADRNTMIDVDISLLIKSDSALVFDPNKNVGQWGNL